MMFGELAEARAMFQDVLEWFDAVGTYRAIYAENNLGIISLAEGRYDEAERRFRRVTATPPSPFERISAECQLAVLRVLQDDPGGVDAIEALVPEVCARAEAFTREMVFHNLGWAQMRMGRLDEAARSLPRALPEHSRPASHLETGRVHTLLKRLSEAGVRVAPDVRASAEAGLLERTGLRERWWYTAMEYKTNDLWCWE
jgi:Tfp pilus assembly protein PilF